MTRTGAIADYLAALDAALPGPPGSKRALLAEARNGLLDAAAAHEATGRTCDDAEEAAVAAFGAVSAVAPAYQQEIVLRQARRTSRTMCRTLPPLFLAWQALLTSTPAGYRQVHGLLVLAAHLAGVAALTTLLGAAALPLTGGLSRTARGHPVRLPRLVGDAAIAGGVAAAGGLAAMLVGLRAHDPAYLALAAGSLVALAHTAWSGATCRRTAPHIALTAP